jgi:hypothetical protein
MAAVHQLSAFRDLPFTRAVILGSTTELDTREELSEGL